MIPLVFVSRPNVLSPDQQRSAAVWDRAIQSMGMELLSLPPCSSGTSLWQELRTALRLADGVVVFGMRQLRVDEGCWRPETEQSASPRKWWSTPWNQLESGMAIMAGMPTLILREAGVAGGIFDENVWVDGLFGAELGDPSDHLSVVSWADEVLASHSAYPSDSLRSAQ